MLKENHYQFEVKILIRSYQVQISKMSSKSLKLLKM